MARMIPPVLDEENTPSPGERLVYRIMQQAPGTEDWVVLHSQRLSHVRNKARGEADFVVLVPGKGVLVLEVKAHQTITRENGTWLFGTARKRGEDPLAQASKAMYAIREAVRQALPSEVDKVFFADAVAFTHAAGAPRSPEWRMSQLIEQGDVTSDRLPVAMEKALEDAAAHLKKQGKHIPSGGEGSRLPGYLVERLIEVLRPTFELVRSWPAWRRQHEDELLRLTRQQYRALDMFARSSRVVFEGPAGTGKTVLAIEAARRALAKGERVLLVCHNAALGDHLKQAFAGHSRAENLEVGTIHSYLLRLCGLKPPSSEGALRRFYQEVLPYKALELLTSRDRFDVSSAGFDTIVIDELQDLAQENQLILFPALLRSGDGKGRIIAFGDLENQAFFEERDTDEVRALVAGCLGPGVVPGDLTVNCRNPEPTVELVGQFIRIYPPYSDVLRKDVKVAPEFKLVSSQPRKDLVSVLDALEAKGVDPRDIAVLSLSRSDESLAATVEDRRWSGRLKNVGDYLGRKDVLATSVYRFKGLERPIIVLTDTHAADPEKNPEPWYVGLTRSTLETIVLVDRTTQDLLAELILGSGLGAAKRGVRA